MSTDCALGVSQACTTRMPSSFLSSLPLSVKQTDCREAKISLSYFEKKTFCRLNCFFRLLKSLYLVVIIKLGSETNAVAQREGALSPMRERDGQGQPPQAQV